MVAVRPLPMLTALIALSLHVAGAVCPANAAEYFVAPDGDNRAAGTRDKPFRNINRALNAARLPGDIVTVRAGVYQPPRSIIMANPGTPGKPITLRAAKGEKVIIDGSNSPQGADLVSMANHHTRIEGFAIRNSKGSGVVVWGPGSRVHHIAIVSNTIHHCFSSGVFVGFRPTGRWVKDVLPRDVLIEGNTVYQCSLRNIERKRGTTWSVAVCAGPSRNVTIRKNTVYENHGEGIGFYLADGGVAEDNTSYDNFAVNLYLDNATNTRVARNFVYNTGNKTFFRFGMPSPGIQIANEDYGRIANPSTDNVIVNNIVVNHQTGICWGAYQQGGGLRNTLIAHNTVVDANVCVLKIERDRGHKNSRIENNIFLQTGGKPITHVLGDTAGITFRNNLWSGGYLHDAAKGPGDVYQDPRLLKAGDKTPASYQLKPNSPARGAGVASKDVTDAFGGQRRQEDGKPNLGAWATRQ